MRPRDVAEQRKVGVETVRPPTNRLLAMAGVKGHAELGRVLMTLAQPATVAPG